MGAKGIQGKEPPLRGRRRADWGRGTRGSKFPTRAHVRGRFQIFLVRSEYTLFAVDLIATCMVGRSRPPGARAAREEKIHENVRSVPVQIFRPRSRRCFSDIPCSFGISVIRLRCTYWDGTPAQPEAELPTYPTLSELEVYY